MKKKLFILSILLIFAGCNKKTSKIEVIPNYDEIYLTEANVDIPARPIGDDEYLKLNDEFKKVIMKIHGNKKGQIMFYPIAYRVYIGKGGNVDKIMNLTDYITGYIMGKHIDINSKLNRNNIYNNQEIITQKIIPIFQKTKFTPAKLGEQFVPFRTDIKAFAVVNKKDQVNLEIVGDFNRKFNFSKFLSESKKDYFIAVEEMPVPIGGLSGIQKKIKYTQAAINSGIEGKIYVLAFINKKGIVAKAKIIKGLGYGLDENALQAVKATRFKPGKQRGKPVNVQVSIPIVFSLKK